jgi:hypothetical protein
MIFESLKRNDYVSGRALTPQDLQTEQDYFLEKLRRHNRLLHGFGVVSGLKAKRQGTLISMETGLALDCYGNEIVVPKAISVELPVELSQQTSSYLCLKYAEKLCDPISSDDNVAPLLIEETFEIVILSQNPHRNHRRQKSRWVACGERHALALVRLQYKGGYWRTDRRYHAPQIK